MLLPHHSRALQVPSTEEFWHGSQFLSQVKHNIHVQCFRWKAEGKKNTFQKTLQRLIKIPVYVRLCEEHSDDAVQLSFEG